MNIKNIFMAGSMVVALGLLTGCNNQASQTQPQQTIATVNYDIVIQKHPKIKDAQEAMRKAYEEAQGEMNTMATLSPSEQQAKMEELQNRMRNKEKEVFDPITKEIDTNIETVMKEKKFSAVADKRAIKAGGKDITVEVLVKGGMDEETAKKAVSEADK